jgi:hypothetical protein
MGWSNFRAKPPPRFGRGRLVGNEEEGAVVYWQAIYVATLTARYGKYQFTAVGA